MPYITQADLEARYGAEEILRLADRNGDGAVDAEALTAAIADAEAVVDSLLSAKCSLPLSPAPPVILRLACSIARYHLYDDKPTERVEAEYKAAMTTLGKLATGELLLMGAQGSGSEPQYFDGTPQFQSAKDY